MKGDCAGDGEFTYQFGSSSDANSYVINDPSKIIVAKDIINEPAHYSREGFQVWDIIEHFNLNYNMGNVAKYILRAGVKTPDPLEDYKKARAYINREIAIREGQTAFRRVIAGQS